MQRSTTVNAQDLCGFLELLFITLLIIHVFIVIVIFILVAAARRSVSLPLLGLATASSSAGTFLAGSTSSFLGLLLVAPLVLSFLLLNKLFDFLAVLEIVTLGAVNLTILLAGAVLLVGGRHRLGLLVGATSFSFLGATSIAGLLDS